MSTAAEVKAAIEAFFTKIEQDISALVKKAEIHSADIGALREITKSPAPTTAATVETPQASSATSETVAPTA